MTGGSDLYSVTHGSLDCTRVSRPSPCSAVLEEEEEGTGTQLCAIHQKILDQQFVVVRSKELIWRKEDSERFYAEHKDSLDSAEREITFFFPEFNKKCWYEMDEPLIRAGYYSYSKEQQIHMPCTTRS
ncbi:NDK6 kinase, partial [Polypterus senegalus]